MAVHGNGREYDLTFKIESNLATTASQYLCVAMTAGTTTADRTVQLSGGTGTGTSTIASYHTIGINQTYLSAGAQECSVRMFGVSKAVAHASVTAGDWIIPYFAATTISTFAGRVVALADGGSVSVATQSIASHICVLGRALEDGSTGTVISVFLNPQLYDKNLTA